MHPTEQDSDYHIFVVPGVGSGIPGLNFMIFGTVVWHLLAPLGFRWPDARGPADHFAGRMDSIGQDFGG